MKNKKVVALTRNIVAFKKGFVCPPNDGLDNRIYVSTVQANLMYWGYILDADAFNELSKADLPFIVKFHDEVIEYVKSITGGKANYTPLYKNFPDEVMSKTDSELYYNAIRHYLSFGKWEPSTETYDKPIRFENITYNVLKYGTDEDFKNIFKSLVSINTSITPDDMEIIKWFVESGEELILPETIPFKENLCALAALGVENLPVKTTTDVLRIATHMSGGDISLPKIPNKKVKANRWSSHQIFNVAREQFKFKKFSRKERKYLLGLLEKTTCDVGEMKLKIGRWLRLGEIIHPFEYQKQFPKAANAFYELRNSKVKSWYAKVNEGFYSGLENGLKILSERPGEFSRRLDFLVRKYPSKLDIIMEHFGNAVHKTSNKVLFEMYTHFEKRLVENPNRSVMIKGARKRTQLPTLEPLKIDVVENIHQKLFGTLRDKFSKLESLGNCWIDEKLKNIPLPTNMRTMNSSQKITIRGQRIPFDNKEAKVIRAFVHWMDKNGDVDIDLSAVFFSENLKNLGDVSFTSLRFNGSLHSGDVRFRKGPCAEYIDIDIQKALKSGVKYVVLDVRNFRGYALSEVECVFGTMERQIPSANPNWVPNTISNTQMLVSDSPNVLVSILDLETMEYIMLDIDSDGIPVASYDSSSSAQAIKDYVLTPKMSVYDLVLMHVEGRGKQVTTDSNIDTYFKYEDFCHSYEKIGEFMGV